MMFWSLHLPRPFALSFLDVGDVVSGLGREHVPDDQDVKIRRTCPASRDAPF
jgi:hypothetical protein